MILLQLGPNSVNSEEQLPKPINRESVYIEKSIADTFGLQNFKDVSVRKVTPQSSKASEKALRHWHSLSTIIRG